ncbi:MAG: 4Fe-4S binding protein [Firmicutes bacterium]|nr:4Fe-4S binding protein [Bacillota bacterium]
MKPKVNDKICCASNDCKAIERCPFGAISCIEVKELTLDKNLVCNCSKSTKDCGGTPYGRIIIDYDKCTGCGICADECCGNAIDMADDIISADYLRK